MVVNGDRTASRHSGADLQTVRHAVRLDATSRRKVKRETPGDEGGWTEEDGNSARFEIHTNSVSHAGIHMDDRSPTSPTAEAKTDGEVVRDANGWRTLGDAGCKHREISPKRQAAGLGTRNS